VITNFKARWLLVTLVVALGASLAACSDNDSKSDSPATSAPPIAVDPARADYSSAIIREDLVTSALGRPMAADAPKPIKDPALRSVCGKPSPAPPAVAGTSVDFSSPNGAVQVNVTVQGWKPTDLDKAWLRESGIVAGCKNFVVNGSRKQTVEKSTTYHNIKYGVREPDTGRLTTFDFLRMDDYVATLRISWDPKVVKVGPNARGKLTMLVVDTAKRPLGIPW
jgi:hypothetical protein